MILEKDLVSQFNTYLTSQNYNYGNEIRMGIGIPDIMVGLYLNNGSLYLNDYYHLKIMTMIRELNIKNIDLLFKHTKLPKSKCRKILKDLSSLGALEFNEGKIKILKDLNLNNQGVNISIEVKIKDWKNGLIQAQRYLTFSDYSYLAIKSEYVKNINMVAAKESGIGIIAISDIGIKEISTPQRSKDCNDLFKNISLSYLDVNNSTDLKENIFFSLAQ